MGPLTSVFWTSGNVCLSFTCVLCRLTCHGFLKFTTEWIPLGSWYGSLIAFPTYFFKHIHVAGTGIRTSKSYRDSWNIVQEWSFQRGEIYLPIIRSVKINNEKFICNLLYLGLSLPRMGPGCFRVRFARFRAWLVCFRVPCSFGWRRMYHVLRSRIHDRFVNNGVFQTIYHPEK